MHRGTIFWDKLYGENKLYQVLCLKCIEIKMSLSSQGVEVKVRGLYDLVDSKS